MATIIDKLREWKEEKANELRMGELMMLQKKYETATTEKEKKWAAARLKKLGMDPEAEPFEDADI
jgi:hypothetical protein